MARPIWTGYISFGLVSIPVTVQSAENSKELSFNLLDNRNKARVRYQRVNETTGEEVPWGEIVKAYPLEGGDYMVLEEDDFKRAAVEATQTVEQWNPDQYTDEYRDALLQFIEKKAKAGDGRFLRTARLPTR